MPSTTLTRHSVCPLLWPTPRPACSGNSRQILYNLTQEWNDPEFNVSPCRAVPRCAALPALRCAACAAPGCSFAAAAGAARRCPALVAPQYRQYLRPTPSPGLPQLVKGGVGGEYEDMLRTSRFCFTPYGWGYGALRAARAAWDPTSGVTSLRHPCCDGRWSVRAQRTQRPLQPCRWGCGAPAAWEQGQLATAAWRGIQQQASPLPALALLVRAALHCRPRVHSPRPAPAAACRHAVDVRNDGGMRAHHCAGGGGWAASQALLLVAVAAAAAAAAAEAAAARKQRAGWVQ